MVSLEALNAQVKQFGEEAVADLREFADRAKGSIANPKRFEAKADGATRSGQVIAFMTVPMLIMISLVIIEAINGIMTAIVGAETIEPGQLNTVAFLVTGLTLGLLIMVGWLWFHYVRTAGFGAFTHDD